MTVSLGITRRLERLLDRVPLGAEHLELVSELVRDDLLDEADLLHLLGEAPAEGAGGSRVPRIRPVLVALAARASGAAAVDRELQYAAELLHLGLAAHDLALGRSGGRRRRVARRLLHRSVGWAGGSPMTLRALELARHASSPEVLGELVDTLREVADGEAVTARLRSGELPSREHWREHADGHTGAVFAFCCRAGGHLGQADPATLAALGRYGRYVGRLWHVAEDVALLQREGGAHLRARARSGRPVLAVIEASSRDPLVGEGWARLVSEGGAAEADRLAERVLGAGVEGRCREVIAHESWAARRVLQGVAPSRYRRGMERLAAGLARAA